MFSCCANKNFCGRPSKVQILLQKAENNLEWSSNGPKFFDIRALLWSNLFSSSLIDCESFLLRCNALLFCTLLLRLIWASLLFPTPYLLFCTLLCFHYNSACECKSELDTVSSVSFFYSYLKWIHLFMIALVSSFHLASVSSSHSLTTRSHT